MNRILIALTLILSLLMGTISPVLAQTGPSIFLPLIDTDAIQQPGELRLSPDAGAIQSQSSETVTSAKEVSAAGRGISADDLKLVSIIVVFDESVSAEQLAAISGGQVIHRYDKVFNGASLVVDEQRIGAVQAVDGVQAVYLDTLQQPDTEVSPAFIGAPTVWNALGGQSNAGEGVVVGILDTGIWPEHPSFSDPDPLGESYSPPAIVPSECNFGNTAANPNDAPFICNNKLIGAYAFIDTYKAVIGLLPDEFDSARDDNGHGTHTASTSAGNAGVNASIFGVNRGVVSGIAPRAHVIAYRVCADQGCYQSDSVAAVDQAIEDGVNVINFSISGGNAPYGDAVELAFLDAYASGIFVAASAGNEGPGPDTVGHLGPWVTTVGASTSNRQFLATVSLSASNGDTLNLSGVSVTDGIAASTPVVISPDPICPLMAPGTFNGEIVVCDRGVLGRVEKGFNVLQAGASGMILRNLVFQDVETDNHFLPAVHLNQPEGDDLDDFISTHSGVVATLTSNGAAPAQGDVMAGFSSRGGPAQSLGLSKPDITAPGVQILAGASPLHVDVAGGPDGELFQAIAGTSMSSPHIAGAAAILKDLHPDWTPGQIKSAIMTTAVINGVTKEDGVTPADPFDFGSGRVDLTKAGTASITFDEVAARYVALKDELWNANYPSLFVPAMPGRITVARTVHNELGTPLNLQLSATSPSDVKVTVPKFVNVAANGDATFEITVDASTVPQGEVRHALLQLRNGKELHHFPITLVRGQPVVTLTKTCEPPTIAQGDLTSCVITAINTSFADADVTITDRLPPQINIVKPSVTGADVSATGLTFNGTLAGAEPPIVSVAISPTASPGGYIPLSIFGITPIGGFGDETIVNFVVPAYMYAGESYDELGIVSNGYVVVGGGTGLDVDFINTDLPDPTIPNNILAPFWTDLNPGAGGALRIGVLTDGTNSWIVVEWENVPNFSDTDPGDPTNSFQIWIGIDAVQDISFVYGANITAGDIGFLTVGAENRFGNSGGTVYFDGTGTAPTPSDLGYEVDVTSIPGAPGEEHVITFDAKGQKVGDWKNCAEMTTSLFQGVNIACAFGEVTN